MTPKPTCRFHATALAVATLLALPCHGMAQALDEQPLAISIPAQPLGEALSQLGAATGSSIAFPQNLVAGKRAPMVKGMLTLHQALARLLAGYGLEAQQVGGSIIIQAAGQASETLPVVTVNASQEQVATTGAAGKLLAQRSVSATKTDTSLMETPRAVTVVSREQMDLQAVQTIEQALRYTAGISTETNGVDTRHEAMVARGFDMGPVYVDGLRTFKTGSYGDWIAEQQGLEQVEFVKGPVSVLYGQGSPGGLINLITKKPSLDAANEVSVSVGNHQRYETAFDLNSKLDETGDVLFRINGLARDSHTQFDFGKDDRLYLAPSISWTPSARTKVTLQLSMIQDRMLPKSWWPLGYLTQDPATRGPLPSKSMYTGEPGFDHYNRNANDLTYLLEHQLDEVWSFSQSVRYSHYQLDYAHVYGSDIVLGSDGLPAKLARRVLLTRTNSQTMTMDNHAQASFNTGDIRHQVLLGLDYQKFRGGEDQYFSGDGAVADLDLFNPVYGNPVTLGAFSHVDKQLDQLGLYTQDQIHWGRWIVDLGMRHDRATTSSIASAATHKTVDGKASYNTGVLYETDYGLSPYASYSTSFMPNVDTNNAGDAFKPETGRQFELGLKFQPHGDGGFITASVFDLRKQNVTTPTPDQTDVMQTGEIRARGLELEGQVRLMRNVDLSASYTYLDSKVTSSNDPTQLGLPYQGTSRNTAKLWLDYHMNQWTVGMGVRYVGPMAAGVDAVSGLPYTDQAYTLLDAALRYRSGPFTLSLAASNLFNKITVVANQFYSQGRVLKTTASYRW